MHVLLMLHQCFLNTTSNSPDRDHVAHTAATVISYQVPHIYSIVQSQYQHTTTMRYTITCIQLINVYS